MDNKTRTRTNEVRGMMIRGVPITIPTANNGGKSMQQPRFTAATRKTMARKQKQNEQIKKANNDTQTKSRNNKKVNINIQTELSKRDIDDIEYENDNLHDNLLAQRMRANNYKNRLEMTQYMALRTIEVYNRGIRRIRRENRHLQRENCRLQEENEELKMKVQAFEEMCRLLNINVEFDIREVEI